MGTKKLLLIAAALMLTVIGLSAEERPVIEVNGTATVNIVPDRITIEIGMSEYYKHVGKRDSIHVKIQDIEKSVRKTLKKAGVGNEATTVSDMGNYSDRTQSGEFLMAKSLSAVVSSFDQLDRIANEIGGKGIVSFRIARLDNSEMERYNKEGLKAALDAAREKAEFIAGNENVRIVIPIEITEQGPMYYETPSFSNVAYNAGSGMENMRRIVRRYSVKVRYLFNVRESK